MAVLNPTSPQHDSVNRLIDTRHMSTEYIETAVGSLICQERR